MDEPGVRALLPQVMRWTALQPALAALGPAFVEPLANTEEERPSEP